MYSILIADDEKYVRQDIIRSVSWTDHGYFIVGEASNGAQALEKIKELQPDVLITDIRMPLTDGLSLIERALKLQPNLHSVIVSGYEDFHYAREAIRLNVLDYLTKPIDETSILSMLKKLTTALEGDNHNRTSAPASVCPIKKVPFPPAVRQPQEGICIMLSYLFTLLPAFCRKPESIQRIFLLPGSHMRFILIPILLTIPVSAHSFVI